MGLGKNCGTCIHAEETDDHGWVICTHEQSKCCDDQVSSKGWCELYEPA